MNIFKPQEPYFFRPPKYAPLLAPLLGKIGEWFMLRRKFNVQKVAVEAADRVAALVHEGHSVLITPNHADHADPFVLNYIGRRWRLPFHYMAAREGFERSRWNAFVMQRSGVFSVDREGVDLAAVKTAIKILRSSSYPLVIFPEGEIYHHHERLALLNEGVATIRLRSVEGLPAHGKAYVVPTAMRYFYKNTVSSTFSSRLGALEERITWKPRPGLNIVDRIYRLGSGLLAIKEVEFLGHGQSGTLVQRIINLQIRLVEKIEARRGGLPHPGAIPDRVKALRNKIRKKLFDESSSLKPQEIDRLGDDLDTLFLAVQLYSYPGQYLRENPTIHRIAETILKLEEDVLDTANYDVERRACVRFGEPIEIGRFLHERALTARSAVGPLTEQLATAVQAMIEQMEPDRR